MAILILNRFPAHLVKFIEWYSCLDDELYMFTVNRFVKDFPEYTLVRGFENYVHSDLLEIEAIHLFEEHPYRAIIALDESDIIRAARLREYLGLKGQHLESAIAFRNKCVMKSIAQNHGIPCASFTPLRSVVDLYDFVKKQKLPVILKPIDEMGSIGVKGIYNDEQLAEIYHHGIPANFMVETFVHAQMYEIDGLVVDYKMKFCSVGKYHNSQLFFQENGDDFTEILAPEDTMYQRLRQFVQETLRAFPVPRYCSFHCEVFHTPDDHVLLCEIASRSPGGRITECIRQSYGIDLDEIWSKLECGIETSIPTIPNTVNVTGTYLIPKQIGRLESMISEFPFFWVTEYQPRVKQGYENAANMSSCNDIIGSVVFQGANQEELLARFYQLRQYVHEHIKWISL